MATFCKTCKYRRVPNPKEEPVCYHPYCESIISKVTFDEIVKEMTRFKCSEANHNNDCLYYTARWVRRAYNFIVRILLKLIRRERT